jgi:hypothetical protein
MEKVEMTKTWERRSVGGWSVIPRHLLLRQKHYGGQAGPLPTEGERQGE